jgi:hypothetical protein
MVGLTFTGATVAIEAKVLEVVAATGSDPATLYVQYADTFAGTAGESAIRMTAGDTITSGGNTLTRSKYKHCIKSSNWCWCKSKFSSW